MKRTLSFIGLFVVFAFATAQAISISPQQPGDPAITTTSVRGKVTEKNAAAGTLTIKTDAGSVVLVNTSEKTTFDRMPPGVTDRTKAIKTSLTEITVGDGIYARGFVAADRKSVPAQQIVVVSQSDIAQKQEKERMEWRRRGVSGIVASTNPTTKEVTITSRALMGGPQSVVIPISDKTKVLRYPPDSIPKYSDAKRSSFEEVKVGDQLRALGDKSADGLRLTPEEVVFGTFKIAGGTVTAVDPATNTITINDLQTKKPMTIVLKPDTVVRRFTGMMGGGPGGPGGPPAGGGAPPAGGTAPPQGQPQGPGAGQRPGGGGPAGPGGPPAGGGGPSMADMIERLPTIAITEIKVGDMIIMSTLPGADQTRLTAVSMVTGVEPLLTMLAQRQAAGGGGQPRPSNVDLQGNFGGMFGGGGP
ncbi:MAG TPA: hypothetical protein VFX97_00775 [Pyrinomonadaceae bacterium]|nr:hypothetical protein [Pyrinomonadaceae bacterium]